jgi:hypothetical protein
MSVVSAVAESKVTVMLDLVGWDGVEVDGFEGNGDADGDALGEVEGSGLAELVGVELGVGAGPVGEEDGAGAVVATLGNFATVLQPEVVTEVSLRQRFDPAPPSMRSVPLPPKIQSLPSPPYRRSLPEPPSITSAPASP